MTAISINHVSVHAHDLERSAAFLEVLKEQTWHRRPASASDLG